MPSSNLLPDRRRAIVEKMRAAYKAPVADADVPGIAAYLNGLDPG